MSHYNEDVKDPIKALDPRKADHCMVKMIKNRAKKFTGVEIHISYIDIDPETKDYRNSFQGPFKFKLGKNRQGTIDVEYPADNAYDAVVQDTELVVDYAIRISKVLTLIELKKERIENITPQQVQKIVKSYKKLVAEIAAMGRSDRPNIETRDL